MPINCKHICLNTHTYTHTQLYWYVCVQHNMPRMPAQIWHSQCAKWVVWLRLAFSLIVVHSHTQLHTQSKCIIYGQQVQFFASDTRLSIMCAWSTDWLIAGKCATQTRTHTCKQHHHHRHQAYSRAAVIPSVSRSAQCPQYLLSHVENFHISLISVNFFRTLPCNHS